MVEKPNKVLGVLSYLIPFVGTLIVLLVDRRNLFSMYHACQALALALFAVLLPVTWLLIFWAIAWIPMAGPTFSAALFTIVATGLVMALILVVVGIMNVLRERMAPLFMIGLWGERLFVRLYPESVVKSST